MVNPHKARWAAEKAQQLERQAREISDETGDDWRQRQRRRDAAARLRREAMRYRQIAERFAA